MIPFFQKKPAPLSLAQQLEEKLQGTNKSILFVEDDMALQDLMNEVRKAVRVDVVGASTAGSAKAMIKARAFDLAILDVGIMNGDGLTLYQWIQDNYPRMSVIFLTGGSLDEICPKVHAIGSAPVYSKPQAFSIAFLTDLLKFCGAKPV